MSVLCGAFDLRVALTFAVALVTVAAQAVEPLHARIDELIAADRVGPASAATGDEEFLRRVSLDLTGEIPTSDSARAFLGDPSPDKRAKLVDRLLASSAYARHMANTFSAMLMERRADKAVPAADWQEFLRRSFAANKPYNQLAREILAADGVDPALRPAAKFYLEREGEPNLLTRDVGRIFFGRDLQCAQCHDHPLIESYYQADYYGLFACLSRGVLFVDPKDKDKKQFFAEKGEGGMAFHSVFDPDAKGLARPRLPGGLPLAEPIFTAGDEYTVKPADGVRPVPKYSRRARLANEATSGANRAFNENIVNRLWAHMHGLGLVEPVDLHHVDNPPSHPRLLALLTDEFVANKFDIKALLREIALSQAYQRAIDVPEVQSADNGPLAEQVPPLEAELDRLTRAAAESAKAVEQVQDKLRASRTATVELESEIKKLAASMSELKKAAEAAQLALAGAKTAHSTKQDAAGAVSEAAGQLQAAAERLPNEKPLVDAAAKFQERARQLAAEVAAASKAVADQTATASAAADKITGAQRAVGAASEKQSAAIKDVENLETQSAGVIAKIEADRAAAKQIERKLKTARSLLACREALLARDQSQARCDQLTAELAAARQSLARLTAELPSQKSALENAHRQRGESASSLAASQQAFDVKNSIAQSVALAAAKAQAAIQKLPGDSELAAAAAAVKSRADQLAAEAAELQKAFTAQAQSAEAAARAAKEAEQALQSSKTQLAAREQQIPALEAQSQTATAQLAADQQKLSQATEDLLQYETRQFATASLKPLSPEQLAASVMQALGLTEQLRAAAEAELNAKTPLTDAIRKDPAQWAARQQQIDNAAFARLHANSARFVELFGAGEGQPPGFFAAADQALFLSNDGQLRGWLAPTNGNLTDRLIKQTDSRALAEELYLSVLTRKPTEAEITQTTEYLARRASERPAAIQELAWALLTTAEFRFNH